MAQLVKAEFSPQNSELTENYPLTSTYMLWHMCVHAHIYNIN